MLNYIKPTIVGILRYFMMYNAPREALILSAKFYIV